MTDREQMILEYMPLATIIAKKLYSTSCGFAECEDLISYAMLGLIDAVDRYDPAVQQDFKAYANIRIRGYIFDQLRIWDFLKKSGRHKVKANLIENVKMLELDTCNVSTDFPDNTTKLDLERAISNLSLLERKVIYYHYIKEIPLYQIEHIINQTYYKTLALHTSAVNKLRKIMSKSVS